VDSVGKAVHLLTPVVLLVVLAGSGCAGVRTASDVRTGPVTTPVSTAATPGQDVPSGQNRGLTVRHNAWVAVSVATVWRSPTSPRAVDAPALARPAAIETWLRGMTLDQRRALNGRADTQALMGDRVVVLALPPKRPRWARVVVPSQPSPLDGRGYPGWVPRRQLTARTPASSLRRATVVTRTAWLRQDRPDPSRLFRISLGTDLPLVSESSTFVRVRTPAGAVRRLARGAVAVHAVGQPAVTATRSSLVDTAELFVGLPYLWAGASGFGVDCSGLTWLDYRIHGLRIPRDALPQSRRGSPVARPRRGDLMFYASSGLVHHVSMFVGDGRMVHSPGTGQRVEVIATSTSPYPSQYVGARRYLP